MKNNRILTIEEIREVILQVTPKYPIHTVRLFGSYADGNAKKDSDIDLMIESKGVFTLLHLCGFENDVSEKLKKRVDILHYQENDVTELEFNKVINLYERNS
jgi:predicted nucleotidyltransferase